MNHAKAFSLIELMVVIAIIAILAAIAVPAYQKYQLVSAMSSSYKVLTGILEQAEAYRDVHGYFPPPQRQH